MAWRDQLRPASFRGVAFRVDGDDLTAGRRGQTHEYPQRDKPYREDLGRAARQFSVTGYVIGPDFMAARDKLLAAIETEGPGELVHPYYGTLQVAVTDGCRVAHSDREGGMCRFSLSFVEAGDLAFPSATANTAATLGLKADALSAAGIAAFVRQFMTADLSDFVSAGAVADVSAAITIAGDAVRLYRGGWPALASLAMSGLGTLVSTPTALAARITGLFAALGNDARSASAALTATVPTAAGPVAVPTGITAADLATVTGSAPVASSYAATQTTTAPPLLAPLARLAAYEPAAAGAAATPVTAASTPARRQQAANTAAVAALVRQAALVQAARTMADSDWPVYDDAIAARDTVAALIDGEAMRPETDDDVFAALTDLRVAVVQDVTARATGAARLVTVTPGAVLPAVAIAYDLYEDADRSEEIVTRNRIAHPGFVAPEPLRVLS